MTLTEDEVCQLVPAVQSVLYALRGGQKTVYKVTMGNQWYALKVLNVPAQGQADDPREYSLDETDVTLARARREIDILRKCNISQLVKLGPIPLSIGDVGGRVYLYYSEEWIEGKDLRTIARESGPMPAASVVNLGLDMALAIGTLWGMSKIHRDIKPANIMYRASDQTFVLLDLGLAFDVDDVSLTVSGQIPGTPPYFSPEQTDPSRKRLLDFRSDMFSLGVVLYEVATGVHPFWRVGMTYDELFKEIRTAAVQRPSIVRPGVPSPLEIIILRLLAKNPHGRYKSCELLGNALLGARL